MPNLITEWRDLPLDKPPYVFPKDTEVIFQPRDKWAVPFQNFTELIQRQPPPDWEDSKFHLGLLPVPFAGDVQKASIFILTLNPGLEPLDYIAEERAPDLREAKRRNLRQEKLDVEFPLFVLNPLLTGNGWFRYWEGRLRKVLSAVAERKQISYREVLSLAARVVCVLELVPYYSFRRPSNTLVRKLASTELVRDFVKTYLAPLVATKERLVIVERGRKWWPINVDNATVYPGSGNRASYFTLNGTGKTLVDWMCRKD